MPQHYGIWMALAMIVVSLQAPLAEATPAKGTMLAKTRHASVTHVAQTPQPGLSAATQRVEDYFNNLTSLQADFVQTVTGERVPSKGTFYWKKPGKFLWLYRSPAEQKVISTGSAVYFVDDRQQATQLPRDAGVTRLFNAKTLNLSRQGLRATSVKDTSRGMSVTFAVDKKIAADDGAGLARLTLTFAKLPGNRLQLLQIDAVDTLSTTTRVEFANVQDNPTLVNKLFAYTPGVYEQRN